VVGSCENGNELVLTNAMEQSPSKDNIGSSSQEIPRILWNLKIDYHVVILPSKPRSPKWYLPFMF
jgi:hypothetical protein